MPPAESNSFGPEEFATLADVSRETLDRLKIHADMLVDWNSRHNLVSRASLAELWRRHFWDSAQLAAYVPASAASLVDLGSGAGFPGLVLAEIFRERPGFRVTLYESTAKKCRFLEAVVARLNLTTEVRQKRIEDSEPESFDVITARACAPLAKLLPYAQRFWGKKSVALLMKGQNVEVELTDSNKSWNMETREHQSRSDPSGVILEIRELHRVVARNSRA
jgi:16S rRNA (guanine527-N7)-methyltransferase